MKKLKILLLFFAALMMLASCKKEESANTVKKQENVSKMTIQKTTTTKTVKQSPFKIEYAGIYQEYLYLGVSYTGGNKLHEFKVNWDGKTKTEGDKKIMELKVDHPEISDNGTSTVYDSIAANVLDLGITTEELKDEKLWLRVINNSNPSNLFLFKASTEVVVEDDVTPDPVATLMKRDVKVVKEGCSEIGLWGDLWLVSNDEKAKAHYVVTEVESSITYTPTENDLLNIEYEYSSLADSTITCSELHTLNAQLIKIIKLKKE